MVRAFFSAVGDLGDAGVMRVLARSLAATLLIFVALALLLGWALKGSNPCGWIMDESCPLGTSASGLGALLLTALAGWFLFPAIALGVIAGYSDRIVAAVEARHYPQALASARPLGVAQGALLGLFSAARLILYNLIAAPFYLLLLITGIGPVILFVMVNGLAIGRDLGEIVASRHGDRADRRAWLRVSRAERAVAGTLVSLIFLVPFLNLLAPVLGAAMMTHLYQRDQPDRISATAASRSNR